VSDLKGQVALVFGGAGMIGSEIARQLAVAGAQIALADLKQPEGDLDGATFFEVDLTDAEAVKVVVDGVAEKFGRLDILICAAGIVSQGSFEKISLAEWDRVLSINLRGVFLACQAAIAPMRKAGRGRIVTIGSILGKNGGNPRPWIDREEQNKASNAAYGAAKAGVHALTLFLAKELAADGITVNCVAPGPIASPMTTSFPETLIQQIPVGSMGKASDVAAAVLWLCGKNSGYVTGEIVDVNGGMFMD
jgi:3-oxoacyl-[acyl-carrier protein] reductase